MLVPESSWMIHLRLDPARAGREIDFFIRCSLTPWKSRVMQNAHWQRRDGCILSLLPDACARLWVKSDLEHCARGAPARAESHPHFCGLCFVEWRCGMKSSLVVDISVIKNTNTWSACLSSLERNDVDGTSMNDNKIKRACARPLLVNVRH